MTKTKMEEMLKKMEGFSMTVRNDYEDNGKTLEQKNGELIDSIETILFRLETDKKIVWNDQTRDIYQWICDMCIFALHDAGITHCTMETNRGRSADLDIKFLYEYKMSQDL